MGGEVAAWRDVLYVKQLMPTNLTSIIRGEQPLGEDHASYIGWQLLSALRHVHSRGVVLRDLKPDTILIDEEVRVTVSDFGSATPSNADDERGDAELTEYVVTRWYRAPEVLLQASCGPPADVWAVGCIMAELLTRKPLFPSTDYMDALRRIFGACGRPSEAALGAMGASSEALQFVLRLPETQQPASWEATVPEASTPMCELLRGLLAADPAERLTAAAALSSSPSLFEPFEEEEDDEDEGGKAEAAAANGKGNADSQLAAADEASLHRLEARLRSIGTRADTSAPALRDAFAEVIWEEFFAGLGS